MAALALLAAFAAGDPRLRPVRSLLGGLWRSSPVALAYVLALAGTTVLLRAVSPGVARELLAERLLGSYVCSSCLSSGTLVRAL